MTEEERFSQLQNDVGTVAFRVAGLKEADVVAYKKNMEK